MKGDDRENKKAEQKKPPSNPWFGAMVFGGGLAVVAVLALPLAVPAIAVGAGAVGLGAVASSTAIGLGFVTTGAVAGGALGYNYGSDVTDFIEKNITNQNKVAESVKESGEAIGERVSGDITGIKADGQASSQQSARSEVANQKIRIVGAAPPTNERLGDQGELSARENLEHLMQLRINQVESLLTQEGEKKLETLKAIFEKYSGKVGIEERYTIDVNESAQNEIIKRQLNPEYKEVSREKFIDELAQFKTFKGSIESLAKDDAITAETCEKITDFIGNFKKFKGGNDSTDVAVKKIDKDVAAIRAIITSNNKEDSEKEGEIKQYFNEAKPSNNNQKVGCFTAFTSLFKCFRSRVKGEAKEEAKKEHLQLVKDFIDLSIRKVEEDKDNNNKYSLYYNVKSGPEGSNVTSFGLTIKDIEKFKKEITESKVADMDKSKEDNGPNNKEKTTDQKIADELIKHATFYYKIKSLMEDAGMSKDKKNKEVNDFLYKFKNYVKNNELDQSIDKDVEEIGKIFKSVDQKYSKGGVKDSEMLEYFSKQRIPELVVSYRGPEGGEPLSRAVSEYRTSSVRAL